MYLCVYMSMYICTYIYVYIHIWVFCFYWNRLLQEPKQAAQELVGILLAACGCCVLTETSKVAQAVALRPSILDMKVSIAAKLMVFFPEYVVHGPSFWLLWRSRQERRRSYVLGGCPMQGREPRAQGLWC